jgi:hypothetical protein
MGLQMFACSTILCVHAIKKISKTESVSCLNTVRIKLLVLTGNTSAMARNKLCSNFSAEMGIFSSAHSEAIQS